MPQYDGQMRLADNLVRIQEERNELLALNAALVKVLEDADRFIRMAVTCDTIGRDPIIRKMEAALAAAQVPL